MFYQKEVKMNLNNWKVFNFNEVFSFGRGQRYKTEDHINGDTAYISSTKENNGIDNFVSPPDYMTVNKNKITLNNSGSIGYSFYHDYDFVASDHCTVIDILDKYNKKLNVYLFLFLKPIIEQIKYKYSFGREISNTRLNKENIKLPQDKNGNPDWIFMENFIKEKSKTTIYNNKNIIREYYHKKLLDTSNWKEFKSILFAISIVLNTNGKNNFIGRIIENNGIQETTDFDDIKYINKGNCLSVIMVGEATKTFYQEDDFISSQNILILRYNKINKYNAMFISSLIYLNKNKYSYGRTLTKNYFRNSKIKLPVDSQGNPDWQFMENYIKSINYSSNL